MGVAASRGNFDIVQFLVEEGGANVEKNDTKGGKVALHHASLKGHERVAEYLIQIGASVNIEDANGNTPLHCTAMYGHTMLGIMLIHHGGNVSQRNRASLSPMEIAQQKGFTEYVVTLSRYIGQDIAYQGTNHQNNFKQDLKDRKQNKIQTGHAQAYDNKNSNRNNNNNNGGCNSNKNKNNNASSTLAFMDITAKGRCDEPTQNKSQKDDALEDMMTNTFVSALTT